MNKDLKTIDDALNSGALNENDDFEFDSATVEIIYGAAERMAERMKFLHEANVTLQAVNAERLEEIGKRGEEIEWLKKEIVRLKELGLLLCRELNLSADLRIKAEARKELNAKIHKPKECCETCKHHDDEGLSSPKCEKLDFYVDVMNHEIGIFRKLTCDEWEAQ